MKSLRRTTVSSVYSDWAVLLIAYCQPVETLPMEPLSLEVGSWSGFSLSETLAFYFLFEATVGSSILRGMVLLIRIS
jgi:hypothetical protein